MQAQAAREASRRQIADALQRTMAQVPASSVDGHCNLMAEVQPRLTCDETELAQTLASHEAALSGLVAAYRGIEPATSGLEIAAAQGRYAASWRVQGEAH